MKRSLFLVFLLLTFIVHLHAITVNNPVDYVSTLVGSASKPELSPTMAAH